MQNDSKKAAEISPEIHEVMRNLVSAIRAVKLYPPNNPVYSQSVRKAYEILSNFLASTPQYQLGVQKTHFSYLQTPLGREAHLNKAIAQDLFAKGIREIVFRSGVTEEELTEFFRVLAQPREDLALKNGIKSLLWEKGLTHIVVREAALDDVVLQSPGEKGSAGAETAQIAGVLEPSLTGKGLIVSGRTLLLGDLVTDPRRFGSTMTEMAGKTLGPNERIEDRLLSLYREAGNQVLQNYGEAGDTLFHGMAKSVLTLDPAVQEGLIAGKLYVNLDSEIVHEQKDDISEQVPNELHEVLTGRFSRSWTVGQVAALLKKSAEPKPAAPPPALETAPIPPDLVAISKELAEYTPEELEALKSISEVGMESDIIEAAVRTLIYLLPLVKNPFRSLSPDKELNQFSGVVRQLEELQGYLLNRKDYDLASLIVRALHMPLAPAFRPRAMEAVKKASTKSVIAAVVAELRKAAKGTAAYQAAYSYLSLLDRDATPVLLELLAEETDRSVRRQLIELLKDLGRNQIALLGERLSDERWYFVRNIVNILGESRADEAVAFLEKVIDHRNFQIRLEVIKSLITIGGKKATGLLTRFLNDRDIDIRFMAVRGLGSLQGAGAEESKALVAFLSARPLKKKDQELTHEAMRALGRIGDRDAAEFLKQYSRVRWWRPRRLQEENRDVAMSAVQEIERRHRDAGRTA